MAMLLVVDRADEQADEPGILTVATGLVRVNQLLTSAVLRRCSPC